jgi:hypothetical protein
MADSSVKNVAATGKFLRPLVLLACIIVAIAIAMSRDKLLSTLTSSQGSGGGISEEQILDPQVAEDPDQSGNKSIK